jgi:acylphosphatase
METPGHRAVSIRRAAKPLLQSRGCGRECKTWRATVENLAKRFFVSGAVQGVGFRFFVERAATKLGVAGYVNNLFDGRVEVYAIGNAAQLDALKNELQRGPRMATVNDVTEVEADALSEYSTGFTIEHDN